MKKIYIKPAAFVERINFSDVVSTSSCATLMENAIGSSSTTCTYYLDGMLIFSGGSCEIIYEDLFSSYDKLCYDIPFYASTLFDS